MRYCARPLFALERLELIDGERVIDRPDSGAEMRLIAFITEAAPRRADSHPYRRTLSPSAHRSRTLTTRLG